MTNDRHTSVLLEEAVSALALKPGDVAVDMTVGAGGHTERLLAEVGPQGMVIGLDRDESALALAQERLTGAISEKRLRLVKARFSEVQEVLTNLGLSGQVAGALADIGVSSMHLDEAERGFSFQTSGPLDMRMDQTQGKTAAHILEESTEAELAELFFRYGEEPQARRIARRIVETRSARPLRTTKDLADLVAGTVKYAKKSKKHPATKVFQALRIAVNDELGELKTMIGGAFATLRPGGRLAVISFHSLEDRIVKEAFQDLSGKRNRAMIPRDLPLVDDVVQNLTGAKAHIVKPFPVSPTDEEIKRNPRARSAKLRIVSKLGSR